MAAPSRESTGRLVTDSTFTLPYAYPSSADYSIESQFDDVPGPYRRQRGTRASTTFGNSTREDYASYLRSIGGGGARCSFDPGHPSWCGVNPGPERYEDGRGFPRGPPFFHGQEAAARFQNSTEDSEGPRREVLAERYCWVCSGGTVRKNPLTLCRRKRNDKRPRRVDGPAIVRYASAKIRKIGCLASTIIPQNLPCGRT